MRSRNSIFKKHNWHPTPNSYEGDPRNDDLTNFSVGFDYDWQRWITVGASISRDDRESNDSQFDYDRNIVSVSLDMSL